MTGFGFKNLLKGIWSKKSSAVAPEVPSTSDLPSPHAGATTSQPKVLQQAEVNTAYQYLRQPVPKDIDLSQFETVMDLVRHAVSDPEFKSSPRGTRNSLEWPLRQIMVNQEHGLMYCPIGKNACTFLKLQMAKILNPPDLEFMQRDIHFLTDHVNTGLLLADLEIGQARTLVSSSNYLKFAVLRDPQNRLLSAYWEKFVLNRNAPDNIAHTHAVIAHAQSKRGIETPNYDEGITFSEFVDSVLAMSHGALDVHWRPQTQYLQGVEYDRIYGFDMLEQLIDDLEARTGRILDRRPENVSGSGRGEFVEAAYDMLPKQLLKYRRVHSDSFFTPALGEKVTTIYHADYDVLRHNS